MPFKVVITDCGFEDVAVERGILEPLGCQLVAQRTGNDPRQLADFVRDADCVITQFAPVDASVIAAMRKCKAIVRYGIGVDNVDLNAAAAKRIPVCNVPDYCTDEVADHTLAMVLAATRQIVPSANAVRDGQWKLPVPLAMLRTLKDMTVGLIGFGRIGREVGRRLAPFKCRIVVHDPAVDPAAIRAAGFTPAGLDQLYSQSDLISLHCPSTIQTRYMVNAASIAKMKRGVVFVNVSRGTLVSTADLVAALKSGHVSAAALDVTDPEPPPPDCALRAMSNVIITSHVASGSVAAVRRLRESAAGIAACAIRGQRLPNVVNGVTQ